MLLDIYIRMSENSNNEQPTSSENSVVLLDDEDNFQEVNYEESSPNSELNVQNTPVIEIEKSDNEKNTEEKNDTKKTNYKEDDNDVYDIIIVGAGISGLSAAYTLKKSLKDIKLLIIEAKNRVGGNFQNFNHIIIELLFKKIVNLRKN